jgi:hypothetical protein
MMLDSRPPLCLDLQSFPYLANLSLWLIPPKPTYGAIRSQIEMLAKRETSSGAFEPHITVLGRIHYDSDEELTDLTMRLREKLKGHGPVPCCFESRPTFHKHSNGQPIWHQSAVFHIENTSVEFDSLSEICRQAVCPLEETTGFAPRYEGIGPHLSMYYGHDNIPLESEIESVPSFSASKVAIWKTEPSSVAGVKEWSEIATIDLI